MEHFEYVYLLTSAHALHQYTKEAEARGETFHMAPGYVAIANGLQAWAYIGKAHVGDAHDSCILKIRHRDNEDRKKDAQAEALTFFDNGFVQVPKPVKNKGFIEHTFYSDKIAKTPWKNPAEAR